MKISRIAALLFLCALIGFTNFSAEARFGKLKKKIENKLDKDNKKKEEKNKEGNKTDDGIYAENLGTGVRKTGGTYAGIEMAKLQDTDTLQFKCVSGKCNSVTVHGRTSSGIWSTLYQGALKDVNVGSIVTGNRSRYTHLLISVNGAHESYDKTAAKMKIIKIAGKQEKTDSAVKKEEKPEDKGKSDKSIAPAGQVNLTVGKSVEITVPAGEFGYVSFTIKDAGSTNYRVNVWDRESKGHFTQKLFSDAGYSKEIPGKANIDYGHPLGGKVFFKDYNLGAGTYYLRIKNDSSSGSAKVEVDVFKYNPRYDSERG